MCTIDFTISLGLSFSAFLCVISLSNPLCTHSAAFKIEAVYLAFQFTHTPASFNTFEFVIVPFQAIVNPDELFNVRIR